MSVQVGLFGMLALIFITLKLLGVIAWSWIWVLAPLWAPYVVLGVIITVLFIGAVIAEALK